MKINTKKKKFTKQTVIGAASHAFKEPLIADDHPQYCLVAPLPHVIPNSILKSVTLLPSLSVFHEWREEGDGESKGGQVDGGIANVPIIRVQLSIKVALLVTMAGLGLGTGWR